MAVFWYNKINQKYATLAVKAVTSPKGLSPMANPNNIVRLHSRTNGRASVLEANMGFQIYDNGILTGNGVIAPTGGGMSVVVGGTVSKPDIVIAETPAGYKVALDIAGSAALTITAPTENSKIVAIVAYTDDLSVASEDTDTTGNPSSCGLLAVSGTAAATPTAPTDAQIRAAITADGATGSQAAYSVIAYITVATSTDTITSSLIESKEAFFIKVVPDSELDNYVGQPLEKNHFIFGYKEA